MRRSERREKNEISDSRLRNDVKNAVCLEGNIDFYGKSGFVLASTFGIRYHDTQEEVPFFLCKELIPNYLDGVTGEYTPPQGYFVDEEEAEQFDKGFPPKEKQKLPGQIF